jgi:hypothetical protein
MQRQLEVRGTLDELDAQAALEGIAKNPACRSSDEAKAVPEARSQAGKESALRAILEDDHDRLERVGRLGSGYKLAN